MNWRPVIDRLREPSTWSALAAVALLAGQQLPAELVGAGPDLVALVCAVVGVLTPEGRRPD